MNYRTLTLSFSLLLLLWAGALVGKQDVNEIHRSQAVRNEKSLDISVEYGLGDFMLKPGAVKNAYTVDIRYDNDRLNPQVDYGIREGVGYLEIRSDDSEEEHTIDWKKDMESTCTLTYNPNLPTEIDLDIGLGKGIMEFGGTRLTGLEVSNGLSETELNFNRPNKTELQHMEFETGLGKFRAKNLSNARFHELSLEVGLGSALLDFHGN
ncbi:MAG TPA: hypothetical protein VKA68_07325, partial [bacterium]|nr:hypothetical protein [bacterium]